jgi:uncharacterized repeat protein (TIGR01451 family)
LAALGLLLALTLATLAPPDSTQLQALSPPAISPQAPTLPQPSTPASPGPSKAASDRAAHAYAKLPLSFVPNAGQADRQIRYYAQGAGFSFSFMQDKAVLAFEKGNHGHALELRFLGANPNAKLTALDRGQGRVNYLVGSKHQTNLHTYRQLAYRDLWPGIDMVFRGKGGKLTYEFHLHRGANPRDIRLAFAGAEGLSLGAHGALLVDTPIGGLRDARPQSFQRIDGRRVPIASRYALAGGSYGFALGHYDRSHPLTIDPSLAYSTYLGGSVQGNAIAVDSEGAAYVTGETNGGQNFPTTAGAFDTNENGNDAFVTKLNPSGSSLAYSTFLGGSGAEAGGYIAVDSQGAAYVAGLVFSNSTDFPTTEDAFDRTYNGGLFDGFVAKLNPSGSSLAYSTFLGGSGNEQGGNGNGIAVDSQGAAYVTGKASNGFPTTLGAFNRSSINSAFVTKLNPSGSSLDYSTFLGGSGSQGNGIAVDSVGAAYVAGEGGDSPTTLGAFDTSYNGGSSDGFVTKLNPTGSTLDYSTYLGGSATDRSGDIAIDSGGAAYVTTYTESTNAPTTPLAFDTDYNGGTSDALVSKLNASGSSLDYSAYLGGSGSDEGLEVAVDSDGAAYVAGRTDSADFSPGTSTFDPSFNGGSADVFVTKLNDSGSALDYATYLGGSAFDYAHGIAVDSQGAAYVTGLVTSEDFPTTTGAFDQTPHGSVFVTKLLTAAAAPTDLSLSVTDDPDPIPIGQTLTYTLTVTNSGSSGATGIAVVDNLPASVTFQSANDNSAAGSCPAPSGQTVRCTFGALASGQSITVQIIVIPQVDGTITDSASVSANEPDPNSANDSVDDTTTVNPTDSVSEPDVAPDQTIRTGTTPSSSDPVDALLTTPDDGQSRSVSLTEGPVTQNPPSTFSFVGGEVHISVSPDGTIDDPLVVQLRLDLSSLPPGQQDVTKLKVFKDAAKILDCDPSPPRAAGTASPDPCVSDGPVQVGSYVQITVLTSTASIWDIGAPKPTCNGKVATIVGTNAGETLTGTTGNDVIVGLNGNDTISGGAGNDTICGGDGTDSLDGGTGADFVSGGTGTDTANYATRTTAVTIDLDNVADDGNSNDGPATARDNVRADIENLTGGSGADTLTGSAAANTLDGRNGADILSGLGGIDTASYATRTSGVTADLDNAADDGNVSDGPAGARDNVKSDIENLIGGAGADTLTGSSANNTLDGRNGADILSGLAGSDAATYAVRTVGVTVDLDNVSDDGNSSDGPATARDNVKSDVENLIGGKGADTLTGSASNNRLTGGLGADSLLGLAGNDTLFANDGLADAAIDCDGGTADIAHVNAGDPSTVGCETVGP